MDREKHILVVDDSPTIRRMVIVSLRSLSEVRLTEASNGLEALERLALEYVDLMILDLNMPDIHGFDVLRFIRDHQQYRNLPLIILTTRGDLESRVTALASGASRYLTKPFDPQVLATTVRELLESGMT